MTLPFYLSAPCDVFLSGFEKSDWLNPSTLLADKTLSSHKNSVEWNVKVVRLISTVGTKVFLQFYFSREPVFSLPPGWFPSYVEWILAFPRAPKGSVSMQIWSGACTAAITFLAETVATTASQLKSKPAAAVHPGDTSTEPKDKKT